MIELLVVELYEPSFVLPPFPDLIEWLDNVSSGVYVFILHPIFVTLVVVSL